MATLTVGDLNDDAIRRPRARAAENGRSAEAEHREILKAALTGGGQAATRHETAERLAEFRCRTAGRSSATSAELLDEIRAERMSGIMRGSAGDAA